MPGSVMERGASITMSMQHPDPDMEPLVVKPREARRLLACGNTRLYELLAARELESFLDGRSRKITVDSIRRYITRRLPSSDGDGVAARLPRRCRYRKA